MSQGISKILYTNDVDMARWRDVMGARRYDVMKVVTILAQKGGSGKTTLALHLAVTAALEGKSVVIVDVDPQNSAGDWWRAREAAEPALVECEARALPEVIKAAKSDGVDLVIIDTAPHSGAEASQAARSADLVLIPTRPSILDLRAIGSTVDIVKGIGAQAAVVLNACPPSRGFGEPSIVHEARVGLEVYKIQVCPIAITQRAAMSHALIDGRSVIEYEPRGKAAYELVKLWCWVEGEML